MSKQKPFHNLLDEECRLGPFVGGLVRDFVDPEYKSYARRKHIQKIMDWFVEWDHPCNSRRKNRSWKERRRTQYHSDKRKVQEYILKFENCERMEEEAPEQFGTSDEWKDTPSVPCKEWKATRKINWMNKWSENLFPGAFVRWVGSCVEPENPNIEVYLVRIYGDEKTDVIPEVIKEWCSEHTSKWRYVLDGENRKLLSVEKVN